MLIVLLSLIFVNLVSGATTECPTNDGLTWEKLHKSCYTYVNVAASRADAWDVCAAMAGGEGRLVSPNNGAENTIVKLFIESKKESSLTGEYKHWAAGYKTNVGFQVNGTSDPRNFDTSNVQFAAYEGSFQSVDQPWFTASFGEGSFAWQILRHDGNWELVEDNTYLFSSGQNGGSWALNGAANPTTHPYVCELKLTECQPDWYSNSSAIRTLWNDAAAGQTEVKSCPAGYTGTMSRECNLSPVYVNDVNFTQCKPEIGNAEFVETNFYNDDGTGFWETIGWKGSNGQTPAHRATGAHSFYFTSGDATRSRTYSIPDSTARRNLGLTASELAVKLNYPYIKMSLQVLPTAGYTGTITFNINGVLVEAVDPAAQASTDYEWVISRTTHSIDTEMEFSITPEITSASDTNVTIANLKFQPYTKKQVAELCRETDSYRYAIRYPELKHDDSGFMDASGVDLVTKFQIPRQLYFLTIAWTNGTNSTINYYDTWGHSVTATANLDNRASTEWSSDFGVVPATDAKCGSETFEAHIPWESFADVWTATEQYSEEDITPVTDDNGTSYLLTAEIIVTAQESLLAVASNTQRTMPTTRDSTWRFPLGIKFKRTITINSTFTAKACVSGQNICTVRHVTALVTYVQTETFPVVGKSTGTYAEIVVGIKTLVAYPYMFISGDAADDPGTGSSMHADSSNGSPLSAMAGQFDTRSDGSWANFTSWKPPHVHFVPSRENVVIRKDRGDYLNLTYTHEKAGSCDHDTSNPVESQLTKECEQNWYMTVVPVQESCYIDGTYTIYFFARCFKNKPVCVFIKDSTGTSWQNGVTSELILKSPNMCPQMIEQIDLSGSLCPIGRNNGDDVTYADACKPDPSFVQGEKVQFRLDLTSAKAKIASVTLKEIYVHQAYSSWETAQNTADGLIPRHDDKYNAEFGSQGKVMIWRASPAVVLTFDDGALPAITTNELTVITDITNSEGTVPYTSGVSLTNNQAAFEVLFNQYVFPTAYDGQSDLYFTVVATVVYQGFDADPAVGVMGSSNTWADVAGNGSSEKDQEFCANTITNQYAGVANDFCQYHPEAKLCCETCATTSNVPAECSGRRLLKETEERRRLARTMINGGEEDLEATTRVSIRRLQAEINGHIDRSNEIVRFELRMNVNDKLRQLLVDKTTVGTFHDRLEYHMAINANARGQIHVMQVAHSTPSSSKVTVVVDIKRIAEYTNPTKTPYEIAKRLEMAIGSGQLSKDSFFQHIEILGLKYHAVEQDPGKQTVGYTTPIKHLGAIGTDTSSSRAFSLLVFAFAYLFSL